MNQASPRYQTSFTCILLDGRGKERSVLIPSRPSYEHVLCLPAVCASRFSRHSSEMLRNDAGCACGRQADDISLSSSHGHMLEESLKDSSVAARPESATSRYSSSCCNDTSGQIQLWISDTAEHPTAQTESVDVLSIVTPQSGDL